jgi:hypothetical protein
MEFLSQGVPDVECCRLDEYRETRFSSEFQWIEVRSFVEVIHIFNCFEPQGHFQRYGEQEKLYTDFCKACNDNAFC